MRRPGVAKPIAMSLTKKNELVVTAADYSITTR